MANTRHAKLILVLLPAVLACAQTTAPHRVFEVASIKPNNTGAHLEVQTEPLAYLPGGRFTATNVTLVDLIVRAYTTRRIQLRGSANRMDSERYDIIAKADLAEGDVTPDQWKPMVQALLADRFHLAVHHEMQDGTVYSLAGKLPAAFHESKEGAAVLTRGDHGELIFTHFPISSFINATSNVVRTPVIDGTGIQGYYDFTLDPQQYASATAVPGATTSYADLYVTAIQEAFGFRLEKRKAALQILVIDHASPPTGN